MITIKESDKDIEETIAKFANIYVKNANLSTKHIEDMFEILDLITIDIDNMRFIKYDPYWDFLDEVANNIDSGKWKMHPYMWKQYILNANYTPLTGQAAQQRCSALRARCVKILEDSNLPVNGLKNRYLMLRWTRNPNAYSDMISVIKTMIELNKLFSKKGNNS